MSKVTEALELDTHWINMRRNADIIDKERLLILASMTPEEKREYDLQIEQRYPNDK